MTTLTEQRQALRDAIWLHGPEHFDVEHLYTPYTAAARVLAGEELTGEWTACFVGHQNIIFGWNSNLKNGIVGILALNQENTLNADYASLDGWHMIDLDGWNPGTAYDTLVAAGEDDRLAQWHVAVEWLDRAIKGGE